MSSRNARTLAAAMTAVSAEARTSRVILVVPLARLALAVCGTAAVVAAALGGYRFAAGPEALERLFDPPAPAVASAAPVFIDMPETIVNLHPQMASRYLKIGVTIAAPEGARTRIERALPTLGSTLQEFLRHLDEDDLAGSGGLYRLRMELKRRFALVVGEDAVDDVLLRSVLTQ